MSITSPYINLSDRERSYLNSLSNNGKSEQRLSLRAKIIIKSSEHKTDIQISKELGASRPTIRQWRKRWQNSTESLEALRGETSEIKYHAGLKKILLDAPRPGQPPHFTQEQIALIKSLACEKPQDSGHPVTHWTLPLLHQEIINRKIVDKISVTHVGRFLK